RGVPNTGPECEGSDCTARPRWRCQTPPTQRPPARASGATGGVKHLRLRASEWHRGCQTPPTGFEVSNTSDVPELAKPSAGAAPVALAGPSPASCRVMRSPARLSHLAPRAIVVAKLAPTFADAHHLDHEEAASRLGTALSGPLLDDLLAATWQALLGGTKKLDEEGLLEKVAKSLRDRPLRPGRSAPVTPELGAFLLLADLAAGTASDAAGRVMETDAGKARARAGLAAAGQLLARELTR